MPMTLNETLQWHVDQAEQSGDRTVGAIKLRISTAHEESAKAIEMAIEMLKKVQWIDRDDEYGDSCPDCGCTKAYGHGIHCDIAKLLEGTLP